MTASPSVGNFSGSAALRARLAALPDDARVLDLGGWFCPLPRATHVADAMPYQTRLGRLNLVPLPGERFTADTWMLTDFTAPDFRLPVPDKFFDFAFCGQTVEDLTTPEPLLREMRRVARAGVVESPSRLTEQSVGVRDRITSCCGHPHHAWVLDTTDDRLELSPKAATDALPRTHYALPLLTFERLVGAGAEQNLHFAWNDSFDWRLLSAAEARVRAAEFYRISAPTHSERLTDPVIRRLRGLKWRLRGRRADNPSAWLQEMIELSAPYRRSFPAAR
jgi:SAM-dependent methyltransferase